MKVAQSIAAETSSSPIGDDQQRVHRALLRKMAAKPKQTAVPTRDPKPHPWADTLFDLNDERLWR